MTIVMADFEGPSGGSVIVSGQPDSGSWISFSSSLDGNSVVATRYKNDGSPPGIIKSPGK